MKEIPAQTKFTPHPITGWALTELLKLDDALPGFAAFTFRASPLRRQAIFLVLSKLGDHEPEILSVRLCAADDPIHLLATDPLARIARALMTKRVRDIIEMLFGGVGPGFMGALNRIGHAPLDASSYEKLFEIFTDPRHRSRAAVLRHAKKISRPAIEILASVDEPFAIPAVVERLRSVEQVAHFRDTIALIRRVCPDATTEALVESLETLGPGTSLASWVRRWYGKASRFPVPPPFPDEADFAGLHTAEALREAARRFHNCLESKIPAVALGRAYYIEYRPAPAVIEFERLSRGWIAEGVYGPKNSQISAEAARAIRRKLLRAGVLMPAHTIQGKRLAGVARLSDVYAYGPYGLCEPDDFEDALPELAAVVAR